MTAYDVLAENNFGDTREGGLAGPMGLLIIVLLVIATVLLIRNMNKRLRRLPDSFPPATPPAPTQDQDQDPVGTDEERAAAVEKTVLDPTAERPADAAGKGSGSVPKN